MRARGGFSIVDEIYLGLTYGDDHSPRDARSALEFGDDVIVTNSFSKYFNMTGWRLGWLVVPETLTQTFEKLAQNLYICPSTLAQHAALACFEPDTLAIFEERRLAFRRWHEMTVEARGDRIVVRWDGEQVLDVRDTTHLAPGRCGLWTKADAVTRFDDLRIESLDGR